MPRRYPLRLAGRRPATAAQFGQFPCGLRASASAVPFRAEAGILRFPQPYFPLRPSVICCVGATVQTAIPHDVDGAEEGMVVALSGLQNGRNSIGATEGHEGLSVRTGTGASSLRGSWQQPVAEVR